MNRETREKLSNIAYYIIIGVVSVLVMAFVPMVGSEIGLKWNLPDTPAGWVVYSISKVCVACVNMLLFHCFQCQAKLNVKDNQKYLEAREILQKATIKKAVLPMSPKKWTIKQYGFKGTTLFLGSLLSAIGLGQAVLTFNVLEFCTLLFTIIMGVVFGYISMRKAEDYWTNEFYEYAKMYENEVQEHLKEKEKDDGISNRGEDIPQLATTSKQEQE